MLCVPGATIRCRMLDPIQRNYQRLQAFKMRIYSHGLNIFWTNRAKITECYKISKLLELLFTVKKTKLECFGHISCKIRYKLQLIMEKSIEK